MHLLQVDTVGQSRPGKALRQDELQADRDLHTNPARPTPEEAQNEKEGQEGALSRFYYLEP